MSTHHLSFDTMNIYRLLSLERPMGLVGEPARGLDMTFMLPAEAKEAGMMMLDVTYGPQYSRKDPVIIFDREGKILHVWPDRYIPGFFEILQVSRKLLKEQPLTVGRCDENENR